MEIKIVREGQWYQYTGDCGKSLLEQLREQDIYLSAACGGMGKCGKCGVQFLSGAPEATEADQHFYTEQELAGGWRLACEAYPQGDARVMIHTGKEDAFEVVSQHAGEAGTEKIRQEQAYEIAIDIGTTTIAVELLGCTSRKGLHTVTTINHQRAYGSDVISRIQASNQGQGKALQESITRDLYRCLEQLLEESQAEPGKVQHIGIAGNTTMGHLLMGYSCETLGVYPFTPVNIGTIQIAFQELFAEQIQEQTGLAAGLDCPVILLPGISTYVGADISAGMLFCEFQDKSKPCLLIDLGTNGEMALGTRDRILVTSTAAGPAFEGGNISCGMGSVPGAISGVTIQGDQVQVETIGDQPPIGLCGTGVIETTCELVTNELVDETGMLEESYFEEGFPLGKTPGGEPIIFTQKDVREIQLAKSAVRAGIETLLKRYGISYADVEQVYLAGGFGFRIDLEKTMTIGMLPREFAGKIKAVGNSSLGGAAEYLLGEDAVATLETIVEVCQEVELSSDKDFNQFYTDYMFFD